MDSTSGVKGGDFLHDFQAGLMVAGLQEGLFVFRGEGEIDGQYVEQFGAGRAQVFPARIVCLRPGRLIMAKANICPVLRRSESDLVYIILIDVG